MAVAAALLVLASACGPAAAAPAPPADSLASAQEPDSAAAVPLRARWSDQPRFVMLRSLVVPGWGQWHNRSYLKALAVLGVEGWFVASLVEDQSRMDRLRAEYDAARLRGDADAFARAANEYNARLDRFVSGQWLLGGILAYALVDAYVDAHFRTFDIDFRSDPALPRDAMPEAVPPAGGARRAASARLSLGWHF